MATLAVVALALTGTACRGSGADKAGGRQGKQPRTLELESGDDLTQSGAPEFAAAVERLSGGSMHIQLVPAGRDTEIDFERGVVKDVVAGKAALGIVGVRVWDTMGVRSFQALLAPLLVDSLRLEAKVLTSPLARRMLAGVEDAGVVGIALHPGPLRQPLGLPHTLLEPADYRGAAIGMRPGNVARASLRSLGASPRGYVPGSLSGLDGVEIDPNTIVFNGWDLRTGALTTNVVLWPKPYSIFMNRKAFAALTPEQQRILLVAGRDSLAPELRQTEHDAAAAMSEACRHGQLAFVTASAGELAALRRAVRPVYDELERDPGTKDAIAAIERLRGEMQASAAPAARCDRADRAAGTRATASALEGRWRMNWTRKELIAAGISEKLLPKRLPQRGSVTYEFAGGSFRRTIPPGRVLDRGTYTVEGDVLSLVYDRPAPTGYVAGQVYRHRWSIYRNRLTFSRVRGSDFDRVLLVNPLSRVG